MSKAKTSKKRNKGAADVSTEPVKAKSAAPVATGKGVASAPAAKPALDEHRAAPPAKAPIVETVAQMTARLCASIKERDQVERDAKAAAFEFHKSIKNLDGVISDLGRKIEEADIEEVKLFDKGIVLYKSKTTGELLRQRPIAFADKQQTLPIDKPKGPPKGTFGALKLQTVWEHDQFGPCLVVALKADSVRVQTDELIDHKPNEIDIGRADWDANNAYPREMPKPALGQRWRIAEVGVCTVRASDDVGVMVNIEGEAAPKRISRLSFVGAVLAGNASKSNGKSAEANP